MPSPLLQQIYSPENFRKQGHELVELIANYLEGTQQDQPNRKVVDFEEPVAKKEKWQEELSKGNADPLIIFKNVFEQSNALHHPHYMGHQVCPPAPLAALAGLVGETLNNGMAVYEMGMASTAAEIAAIEWTAKEMGFDEKAGGFFTSGGTLANLTALLTARSVKAKDKVWEAGSTEKYALMVSNQAHYCVDRAARIMGWGEEGVIKIPVDHNFRMRTDLLPEYLAEATAKGIRVLAVVGSACSTAIGAFDDLEAIADFCKTHNCWFHVDGAHGGALAFSEKYARQVKGIHLADSMVMDYHKMLLTPTITTALIYKENRDSYQTFQQKANYLLEWEEPDDWYNLARRTFECTKLMQGLKAYTLIATYGKPLFDEYVTRVCDLGKELAQIVVADDQMELLLAPQCNIVCFRYKTEASQSNKLNQTIRKAMLEEGSFYIVQTNVDGETWLRCTLTNALTEEKHLQAMVARVKEIANEIKG